MIFTVMNDVIACTNVTDAHAVQVHAYTTRPLLKIDIPAGSCMPYSAPFPLNWYPHANQMVLSLGPLFPRFLECVCTWYYYNMYASYVCLQCVCVVWVSVCSSAV